MFHSIESSVAQIVVRTWHDTSTVQEEGLKHLKECERGRWVQSDTQKCMELRPRNAATSPRPAGDESVT
jgi:hypothetical protein